MNTKFSIFWIKLTNWEYWPWYLVYIPIYVFWLWCGIKARAIFWISAVNPGFEYGGIVGASKKEILDKFPDKYLPKTILIGREQTFEDVLDSLKENQLDFPVIIKPEIGERGFHVELIDDSRSLKKYLATVEEDHIIQEYLDMPIELGVFYIRIPGDEKGKVTSIVRKQMLQVTGDGSSSIIELVKQDYRAVQQAKRLITEGKIDLGRIPPNGEQVLLEPIGNHNRGTAFLNANELINDKLNEVFDKLAKPVTGFYYGRFDIRCEGLEELYRGVFKVMEVNGAASEPAHIYSPGYPILQGYKDLLYHWRALYKIARLNHKNGQAYMSVSEGWEAIRKSRFRRS